jgi:hypothetical protein
METITDYNKKLIINNNITKYNPIKYNEETNIYDE